jgi:hypothetical protein
MQNRAASELRRAVNDRTYNVLWGTGGEAGDFLCECEDRECVEHVALLGIEYAARREQAILAPGHRRVAPA